MIRLYIADTGGLDIDSALQRVSEARRNKVLRLPDDEKKRQSLGAELLLQRAVGGRTEYSLGENGKPYFEGSPLRFSLAHSGPYAVCAVSGSDIGVDIETPREGSERLAARFFAADENRLVAESPQPDREFCRLWVLKESLIKARGGRLADMAGFSVAAGVEGFSLRSFEHEGCFIGLCVKAPHMDEVEMVLIDDGLQLLAAINVLTTER